MTSPGIVLAGRRALAATMLDRSRVLDRTVVKTAGGTTTTYEPRRGAPLPCRFGPVSDTEAQQISGLVQGKATTAVTYPVGTVVGEGARVRNTATDRLWQVVADVTPDSLVWRVGVRLLLREV